MQLVINIDTYVLEHCKRHVEEHYANNIEEAIANSVPLEGISDKIKAELIQSIQNGTIKIDNGNEKLFHIIDKYMVEGEN